jgi:type I restriction enzyme, S subunit
MAMTARRFKPYPAYKDSGVELLGQVPAHWELKRLKHLAWLNPETLTEDTDPTLEMTYVDIGGVNNLGRIVESEPLTFAAAPSRARRLVRNGDVIVSTVRTYLRAIAPIRDPDPRLVVSTGFAVVRPEDGLTTDYAAYALRAPYFVERVVANSKGVSYPAITEGEIGAYELALPPDPEQYAIATFLDHETAKIDALVVKEERLIELLQEKRAALISQAVTKGLDPNVPMKDSGFDWLGKIPAHWEVKRLKHLFVNLDHRRAPISGEERASMVKDYPYYGASGVIDHVEGYLFDEPLVLVAEDGANLYSRSTPLAFVATGKYWVNNHAHILRPLDRNVEYWAHVLASIVFDPWITGSAQPKLTGDALGSIPLPVPAADEQTTILAKCSHAASESHSLITKVRDAIDRLQELRTALISAAVTGKIDVREEVA